jgi:hypothetical protein
LGFIRPRADSSCSRFLQYTDVRRRWIISERTLEYERGIAALGERKGPKALGSFSPEEKELLKKRWASLKILGRYGTLRILLLEETFPS